MPAARLFVLDFVDCKPMNIKQTPSTCKQKKTKNVKNHPRGRSPHA
jgi:hypothetical protein